MIIWIKEIQSLVNLWFFSGHSLPLPFAISLSLRLIVGYFGNNIETVKTQVRHRCFPWICFLCHGDDLCSSHKSTTTKETKRDDAIKTTETTSHNKSHCLAMRIYVQTACESNIKCNYWGVFVHYKIYKMMLHLKKKKKMQLRLFQMTKRFRLQQDQHWIQWSCSVGRTCKCRKCSVIQDQQLSCSQRFFNMVCFVLNIWWFLVYRLGINSIV